MAMFDFHNDVFLVGVLTPIPELGSSTIDTNILDTSGFYEVEYAINIGELIDVDATFTVTMAHGDDAGLSDGVPVPSQFLLGTLAEASWTFADDNSVRRIGYNGHKRFVRLSVTTANNTSLALYGVNAYLSGARELPTAENV